MSGDDLYLAERTMHMRVAEEHRRADERLLQRLAREGRLAGEARPSNRLLYRLGCALTALGQRLERYGLPPSQRLPEVPSGVGGGR